MSDRILLIDTDIFTLLAGAGLLSRALEVLGFATPETRRLPALPHQLRGKKFKGFPPATLAAVSTLANGTPELTERPTSDDVVQRLVAVKGIDSGEALLFALMHERPVCWLASGDQRAMQALATTEEVSDIARAVSGRVICLEAVVWLLLQADGYAATAANFRTVRDFNKTLKVFFSDGMDERPEECPSAVRSYLVNLVARIGTGFLFIPPTFSGDPE